MNNFLKNKTNDYSNYVILVSLCYLNTALARFIINVLLNPFLIDFNVTC